MFFALAVADLWVFRDVEQSNVTFPDEQEHPNWTRAFLNMSVAATPHIFRQAADRLRAEYFATKQTQCGIGHFFSCGGTFSSMRFFHQYVTLLRKPNQLKRCWVQQLEA